MADHQVSKVSGRWISPLVAHGYELRAKRPSGAERSVPLGRAKRSVGSSEAFQRLSVDTCFDSSGFFPRKTDTGFRALYSCVCPVRGLASRPLFFRVPRFPRCARGGSARDLTMSDWDIDPDPDSGH